METGIDGGGEFEDLTEDDGWFAAVDWETLRQPQVLQAAVAFVAALSVLFWPDLADQAVAVVLAVAVGVMSLLLLVIGARERDRADIGVGIVGLAGAVFVIGARRDPNEALVLLVGAGSLLIGAVGLVQAQRRRDLNGIAGPIVLIGVGLLATVFPDAVFQLTLVGIALGAGLFAAVALSASLDPDFDGVASLSDSEGLIRTWLEARHKEADDRLALYDKILYDGPASRRRLARFYILMAFAAVIASMGVITDSTAVVIGAMLIAPLMTPLMGTAISLIMGWPSRLRRSALVAASGIALAILIGVALGVLAPTEIDTLTNAQILGRSNPTVLDLITALAAGAAGAYGLSRPDVSDALPGVAIAISLVPPLTVVGISFSQGDFSSGNGALLLFITNMLAILIMGGITFVLTGVTPLTRLADNQHRLRTWAGAVATAAVLVVGALAINGAEIARNTLEQSTVESTVADWLAPAPAFTVAEVGIEGDQVTAVIIGPSDGRPSSQPLADRLSEELSRTITVVIRHVVELRDTAVGGG